MFFIGLVLIGMVIPFLLMKISSTWFIWSPAIIFSLAAIFMAVKASVFPGEGMADLAESLYFMMFGTAAFGSIVGGIIVHFIKK
jgi:hypothetical protein